MTGQSEEAVICERCGSSVRYPLLIYTCGGCGRTVCWRCLSGLRPFGSEERGQLGLLAPRLCQDCFQESVLADGCQVCSPYLRTPCRDCPVPLYERDTRSDGFVRHIHAAAVHRLGTRPRLSQVWRGVARRSWEASQRGRCWGRRNGEEVEARPDIRAARMPVDELATRLSRLGLDFEYDVTQANVAALARFKTVGVWLEVCDQCGTVASPSGTYGWRWTGGAGDNQALCPYHDDVDIPQRPDNWMALVESPLGARVWQPFDFALRRAAGPLAQGQRAQDVAHNSPFAAQVEEAEGHDAQAPGASEEKTRKTSPQRETAQQLTLTAMETAPAASAGKEIVDHDQDM